MTGTKSSFETLRFKTTCKTTSSSGLEWYVWVQHLPATPEDHRHRGRARESTRGRARERKKDRAREGDRGRGWEGGCTREAGSSS